MRAQADPSTGQQDPSMGTEQEKQRNMDPGMEGQGHDKGMTGEPQGKAQQKMKKGAMAESGVVQGDVKSINEQGGTVTIAVGEERVRLHATPQQLQGLKRDENVSLPYNTYSGVVWLSPEFAPAMEKGAAAPAPGEANTIAGEVDQLDWSNGRVTVYGPNGRARYLTHPEVIENLTPGQHVSLTFEKIGNASWVSSVETTDEQKGDESQREHERMQQEMQRQQQEQPQQPQQPSAPEQPAPQGGQGAEQPEGTQY